MAKRSHGEGQLSKRANGSTTARVTLDGRRISKTFRLRRDALKWIETMRGQGQQGLTYDSAKTTVGELLTRWLKIKSTQSRPATIESYNRMARLYINPVIGRLALKDLTAARVQKLYDDMEHQGTGTRTIEHTHTVLHGFLKHAKQIGLVAQNWTELVEVPRRSKREMQVWDENQVSQFLQSVKSDLFYRLAFSTGMRRGELLALQWKDIDWASEMILVRRQVYRPEGGGFIFQTPKTDRGTRGVRLGRGLMEALAKRFSETIPLMQKIVGNAWQDYDLIFPSLKGTPRDGYTVSKEFHHLAQEAGLPLIRLHDIRHTAASIMLLHGEPPVRVAGILGQTVAVLLSTYSHWIPDNQESAANLMDEITTVHSFSLENNSGLAPIGTKNE